MSLVLLLFVLVVLALLLLLVLRNGADVVVTNRSQHKTTLGVPKPLRIYLQVAIRMSYHYLEVNSKRLGGRCRMGLGAVNAAPCVHGRRSARGAVNKRRGLPPSPRWTWRCALRGANVRKGLGGYTRSSGTYLGPSGCANAHRGFVLWRLMRAGGMSTACTIRRPVAGAIWSEGVGVRGGSRQPK